MDESENEIPFFDINLHTMNDFNVDELWGSITDEELLDILLPACPEVQTPSDKPGDKPSENEEKHDPIVEQVEPAPKKRRFARCDESDLAKLETARHEKKTVDTTQWAVRLVKGTNSSFKCTINRIIKINNQDYVE